MLVYACDRCKKISDPIGRFETTQYAMLPDEIKITIPLPRGWIKNISHLTGVEGALVREELLCPDCASKEC